MLIDWFTVTAEIINFLVLVWLLKRFLYGRILHAIDERDQKITESLAEAARKEKEASGLLEEYQARLRDLEQQRDTKLAQIKADAEKQHSEMLDKTRESVRELEQRWHDDLEREQRSFLLALRRRAAVEVLTIARRSIADLAGADLQSCTIRVFLEKVRALDRDVCRGLGQTELLVRSALDVPNDLQAEIQQAIEERVESPVILRFERAEELGLGLELSGNGRRIGWSSQGYLEALEDDLKQALTRDSESGTVPGKAA